MTRRSFCTWFQCAFGQHGCLRESRSTLRAIEAHEVSCRAPYHDHGMPSRKRHEQSSAVRFRFFPTCGVNPRNGFRPTSSTAAPAVSSIRLRATVLPWAVRGARPLAARRDTVPLSAARWSRNRVFRLRSRCSHSRSAPEAWAPRRTFARGRELQVLVNGGASRQTPWASGNLRPDAGPARKFSGSLRLSRSIRLAEPCGKPCRNASCGDHIHPMVSCPRRCARDECSVSSPRVRCRAVTR